MFSSKIVGAVLAAGVVAAGASAFTATGLADTAPAAQFIGGTVSQTVTGATLTGVDYGFTADPSHSQIDTVTLTFTGADGKSVNLTPQGGDYDAAEESFVCTAVSAAPDHQSVCTVDPAGYYAGLSGIDVHVIGDQG
jgi:hypothetical protein